MTSVRFKELGEKIFAGRNALGPTQDKFGRLIGLSGDRPGILVSRWERGTEAPGDKRLEKIAAVLHLNTDELVYLKYKNKRIGRQLRGAPALAVSEPVQAYRTHPVAKIETLFGENKVPIEIQEECYGRCLEAVESWLWRETLHRQKGKEGAGK